MTLPNILTLFRIIMIPCFVVCFYLPVARAELLAAAVFGLAALTDWLDGYLARRLGQSSKFGEFLDPVADKLMVAVVLVVLLQARPELWLALPVAVIIGREITVSALREWMAEIGARRKVAVSWLGKAKTTLQMIALALLVIGSTASPLWWLNALGIVLLYVATVITLWSMLVYLRLAWPDLIDS
ncbi:MAG: CDP-diacylglycerol--glycerol-3-phosphate 3-phosphatidyltransferase [Gammaproteobacteria bacterium]